MGNFNRGGRPGGGGRRFNDRGFSSGRGAQMHKATCANCGRECEVPFKPTGERPVYCNDCFAKQGGNESRGRDRRDSREPREERGSHNGQLNEINAKLDRILEVLQSAPATAKKAEKKKKAPEKESEETGPVVTEIPEEEKTIEPLIREEQPAEEIKLPEIPEE